jgi:UPF0755 protein
MWRHIAANALTLIVVFMVVAAGLVAWGRAAFDKPGPLAEAICLKVERGSTMRKVADSLAEQGAVSDARVFRIGAGYVADSGLKAGSFLIREGTSMREIVGEITGSGVSTCGTEIVFRIGVVRNEVDVRVLDPSTQEFFDVAEFEPGVTEAPPEYLKAREDADTRYSVVMAEGATVWQVGEGLKAADFLTGEIKELPTEGLLAPDSYEVTEGADRAQLVAAMAEEQALRIAEVWEARGEGLPYDSAEEMLVMASIIEKETGVAQERPRVASVFVNRLNQGMKLQTDPTVIYGITKGQASLGRGLRQSELRRETPYNTYIIDGLPPGPIANPGLAALQAAVNPEATDFVFFVADGTGGHAFAVTLEDHNANVEKWRAIEAERAAAEGTTEEPAEE